MVSNAHGIPLAALLAGLLVATGCGWFDEDEPTPPPTATAPPVRPPIMPADRAAAASDDDAAPDKPQRYALIVRLRMYSIEVPIGTASGSEDLWSYLDGEPIAAVRSGILGRNGFRAGIGRQQNWPDVERLLQQMTGRALRETKVHTPPHIPVPLLLREQMPIQTIFLSRPDRTLDGSDYPPADNVLNALCTLDEADQNIVMLTLRPVLRSTRKAPRFVRQPEGLELRRQAQYFGFDGLTIQMRLPRGSFLILGPGAAARRPTSLGHHFLVKERDGATFETVLILIPESFLAPVETMPSAR